METSNFFLHQSIFQKQSVHFRSIKYLVYCINNVSFSRKDKGVLEVKRKSNLWTTLWFGHIEHLSLKFHLLYGNIAFSAYFISEFLHPSRSILTDMDMFSRMCMHCVCAFTLTYTHTHLLIIFVLNKSCDIISKFGLCFGSWVLFMLNKKIKLTTITFIFDKCFSGFTQSIHFILKGNYLSQHYFLTDLMGITCYYLCYPQT